MCLNTIRDNNPAWDYKVLTEGNAHLTVLDLTSCSTIKDLTPEACSCISKTITGKTLVLLNVRQHGLMKQLTQEYKCSLLCVDERKINFREIIECSIKKRIYISDICLRIMETLEKDSREVVFTPSEARVIDLLHKGKTGRQIAEILFRSQKTISSHKRSIMKKLGVNSELALHNSIMELI